MNRFSCLPIASALFLPALVLAQASPKVDFKADVAPIFEQHCIKCHFGGSTHADLEMTSRQKLLDQRSIVPGKPDQSVLYNIVKNGLMPPPGAQKLTPDQIAVIGRWVAQGAPWPADVKLHPPQPSSEKTATTPQNAEEENVRQIRERDPRARVIILTTYDTDDEIERALKAGAKAYVLKDISADDLVGCIRTVLAGKTYIAPAAAAKLAEGVTRVQLTPREMATLRLMADGKANKEIATALDISERTVKTHLGHLFEKLGVTSRTEAVKVATRRGLVRLE